MNTERAQSVSKAIAGIGYDGIVAFDEHEPEYGTLTTLYSEFNDESLIKLLSICAATQDFQLNGDAQRFWQTLTEVFLSHGSLATVDDLEEILWTFMDQPVNARFTSIKNGRLQRLFDSGFCGWFLTSHQDTEPLTVWEELADGLENEMHKKTVVLAMKIYDIAHLVPHGEYLEIPYDIPIPCDLQVERVSQTSGLTSAEEPKRIMDAWATVMESVSEQVGHHISLLRIDSIVWQSGQIIGNHGPDQKAAQDALIRHFVEQVGIDQLEAETLAHELTVEM